MDRHAGSASADRRLRGIHIDLLVRVRVVPRRQLARPKCPVLISGLDRRAARLTTPMCRSWVAAGSGCEPDTGEHLLDLRLHEWAIFGVETRVHRDVGA